MTETIAAHHEKTLPALEDRDYPDNARRMMRAAIKLFAEQGFAGTSVRQIVQAADVTNPMLYYYFDNKEGLFNTLITFLFENMTDDLREHLAHTESITDVAEGVIREYFEACKRSPIALKFVYSVLFGPEESAPEFDLFEARQEMVEEIASHFERAIDSGELTPERDFNPVFLTEQLLGIVNNHLMRALKEAETRPNRDEKLAHLRHLLSDEYVENIKHMFFFGAGTLHSED